MYTYRRNKGATKLGAIALFAVIVLAISICAIQAFAIILVTDLSLSTTSIHRGEAVSAGARWFETANASWIEWENSSSPLQGGMNYICAWPGSNCPTHNWTNSSVLTGPNTTNLGTHGVVIKVNDSAGMIFETTPRSYTVYGWANITNATPLDNTTSIGAVISITCRALDKNTSTGIQYYPIVFWKNASTTTALANSTGYATWQWNTAGDTVGIYNTACNITSNASLYYDIVPGENSRTGTVTLSDTLYIVELGRDNPYIYRNDSWSPYTTTISAHVKNSQNNPVQDANVTLYNESGLLYNCNGINLPCNCTTDALGFCSMMWNPPANHAARNVSLTVNATKSGFGKSADNVSWVLVQGVLIPNITTVIDGDMLYRGVPNWLNATTKDELGNAVIANLSWYLDSANVSALYGLNLSWTPSASYSLGPHNLTVIANLTNYTDGTQNRSIQLWSIANMSTIVVPSSAQISSPTNLSCRVLENASSVPLQSYMVKFYSNISGMIDSALTDSNGWANITWMTPSTAGIHNITCNITNDSVNYYKVGVIANSSDLSVYGILGLSASSEAPGGVQVGQGNVPMLRLNFTATGEAINITQINVTLTGSATDGNISAITLWNDSSDQPSVSLPLSVAATFNSRTANLTPATPITVPAGSYKILHILYNVSGSALNSATFGANITNNSNISALGNISIISILPVGNAPYNSSLVKLWGWANINPTTPVLSSYQRGVVVGFGCTVVNVNTSNAIGGYPVKFWINNTLLGTNLTDGTGLALWNWNTTTEAVGPYNITCNITNNTSLYFNVTTNYSFTGQTSLNGTLKLSFFGINPNPVYRNNTFSQNVTTFTARVKDELGVEVYGANISFWNSTLSAGLLGSCLSDAIEGPGQCHADFNPTDTAPPNNYSVIGNASGAYYTSSSQNTSYLIVKGVMYINITNIPSGTVFYKTQNITANTTAYDENGNTISALAMRAVWFLNTTNLTNITPAAVNLSTNWENMTWYIPVNWTLNNYVLNVTTSESWYDNIPLLRPIQIWGWSHVNESSIPTAVPVNSNATFKCRVIDINTSLPLLSHYVNFWSNVTGFIGNNYSMSDGWATLVWPTPANANIINITCNITPNPAQFYTPASGLSGVVRIHGIMTADVINEAPYSTARGTSTGMLRLNLTAIGENISLSWVAVNLFGTATSTNLSAIELWNDTGGPSQRIPGASDASSPYNLTPTSYIIPAGSSRLVHVMYNISGSAMPYKTVGANITDNTTVVGIGVNSSYRINATGAAPWPSTETFIQQLPVPDLLSPLDGVFTSNLTVNFTWNGTQGAVNYTIRIDNSSNVLSPEYTNTAPDLNYTWSSASEGVWYWRVSAVDGGGGQSNSAIWKVSIDHSAPYVNLTIPANGSNWTRPVQLSYSASDKTSTTLNCYYKLDNVPNSPTDVMNGTAQYVLLTSVADGLHNISVNCTDQAGNSNVSALNNFTVDVSGPLISVVLDRNPPYYKGGTNITVNVTASDPSGVSVVTADGVVLTNITPTIWRGNVTASANEGINNITVYANDTADNRDSTSVFYFTDNTGPTVNNVTITYPLGQNHVKQYQNITVSAKVVDPQSGGVASGVNSVTVNLRNMTSLGALPAVSDTMTLSLADPVNNIWNATWNCSAAGYAANLSTFNANATGADNAANTGFNSQNFTVDNTGFAISINSITADKTSASANGTDYWQWTFNVSVSGGTRVRMKVANWTDGSYHIIPVAGYARLQYQNATGIWKTYNILDSYNETETVDALNITSGWTILALNQTIPTGTYPASYSTTYALGIYA